jgi:hypothetical protein
MDEVLARRYVALVYNYKPTVPWIKDVIFSRIESHLRPVRPDAAYFLLVNLDQMLVVPYAGHIDPGPSEDVFRYGDYTIENMRPKVESGLDIVFADLSNVEEVSAHQVMLAIDRNWQELGLLFGWG